MDLLKKLREDNDLSDLLCDVCDVEILSEFKSPQDEGGHLTYNIAGKTFAKARSGSEYILLEDGSIGYWGSEGEFAREIFEEHKENAQEDEFDLCEAQQELADSLGIEIKEDVTEILMCFYHCAKRNPRFIQTYTENDGSTHSSTGSLFDR